MPEAALEDWLARSRQGLENREIVTAAVRTPEAAQRLMPCSTNTRPKSAPVSRGLPVIDPAEFKRLDARRKLQWVPGR